MTNPYEKTTIGTAIRKEWSKDYYQRVLSLEKKLRRPVCAAKTKENFPCSRPPKEETGFYCGIHRSYVPIDENTNISELEQGNNPTNVDTGLTKNESFITHLHKKKQILQQFHRCALCPLRTECDMFEDESHCKIEEDTFYTFIDTIRQDYQIQQFDMYMIYRAAIAYAKSMYSDMLAVDYLPSSDQAFDFQMSSIRLTKEFRESVKALGLTRHQRNQYYQRDMKLGVDMVKSQATHSLAEQMALAASELPKLQEHKQYKDIESVEDDI